MNRLHSLMHYLRVEDDDGVVSVTNVSCWVVLGLLAVSVFRTGDLNIADVGILIATLAHYSAKKVIAAKVDVAAKLEEQAVTVKDAHDMASAAHGALHSAVAELKEVKARLAQVDNRTRPLR